MSKHISILDSARTVAVYTATAASLLAVYAVPGIYFFPFASSETTFCASLFSRIGIVFFTVSLSTLFFIGAYCCAATLHIHNFTYFFQKKGIRIALPTLVAFKCLFLPSSHICLMRITNPLFFRRRSFIAHTLPDRIPFWAYFFFFCCFPPC